MFKFDLQREEAIRKLINEELDRREREAHEQGSFLKSGFSWDFNFWFDRDSWGHRCHPSGRTVELKIDRSECPQCAVKRPDQAPERKPEWTEEVWRHVCECGTTQRTIDLSVQISRCECCGVNRDEVLAESGGTEEPPKRRDESIGQVIDRGEDEHGFWFTVKLYEDHWLHECFMFGRTIVVYGTYCHHCGVEWPQARASTDD